jgi:enterochelin esterase-like enzyme
MKNLVILLFLFQQIAMAQTIKVKHGSIHRLVSFSSEFVNNRNIDVWLPDDYSSSKKYAVLYMHDGQMLFDGATTWNQQEWGVDEHVQKLINTNQIKDVIVVGIWNDDQNKNRHPEYFPQKPFENLTKDERLFVENALKDKGRITTTFTPFSDRYLKFIVEELKPYIDRTFSTLPDKNNTFLMGSSMGGLISMYGLCEYPEVFGAAACISTHWPGIFEVKDNPIPNAFEEYIQNNLNTKNNSRIYFDFGTATLDALYPHLQAKIDAILLKKGFNEKNWTTQRFEGASHSEVSWNERLDIPLLFLLKKN